MKFPDPTGKIVLMTIIMKDGFKHERSSSFLRNDFLTSFNPNYWQTHVCKISINERIQINKN